MQKPIRNGEPQRLRRVDARMVSGLPEPSSPEALDWVREALAELRAREPGAAIDLSGIAAQLAAIEARLAAIEAKPDPAPVDLSGLWDAIAALRKRIETLESERLMAPPPAPEIPPAQIITRDPLDPLSWDSLDAAKAGLEVLVTREAAKRCGQAVTLYEEMVRLDALGPARSDDEELQLLQQHFWARERQHVELARLEHNQRIRRLTALAEALTYDWRANWPEV